MADKLPIPQPTERLSTSEDETEKIAGELAELLLPLAHQNPVVLMYGELGAGKTVFARGFARALGVDEAVPSPTFPIVQSYQATCILHHLDLYRLTGPEDALAFGIDDYASEPNAVCLIEWPERLAELANGFPVVSVELSMPAEGQRLIRFASHPL